MGKVAIPICMTCTAP